MTQEYFMTPFTVKETAKVFASITTPSVWWSGEFEGESRKLNNIFIYRYKDLH